MFPKSLEYCNLNITLLEIPGILLEGRVGNELDMEKFKKEALNLEDAKS